MEKQERELIGGGTRANVYRAGPYALKVFPKGANPARVTREAYIGSLVSEAGLPVPKAYGMVELEEGLAIKMEAVSGKNLHEAIVEQPARCEEFIEKLASLQEEVHRAPVALPFALSGYLRERIAGSNLLEEGEKAGLLRKLEALPQGTALCHGDFHGGNVLTDGTRYTIIDWANATAGHPDADICRTYMIYALHLPEAAGMYLEACRARTGRREGEILRWLPVLAGARLSEGFLEERETLMGLIRESLKP